MFEPALRADSPLLGFPNSQSQDPLRFPSPDYPRLLCDSNKRASIATNYSSSSFGSSLDHEYVQSLYHASTTTNSSICTPLTPLSPSIPEGELGSRWSLASSIEDEPKKKEKKPRKKISKDLLLADGELKRKRLTSFISRLSLGAGSLLSPTNSISSLASNGVHSPGSPNFCNENQDITISYPQSPTTPIDASAATRDRDWSHHASHPSVSSTSTSSSSSISNNHEPPFGLGLGFALESIDERERSRSPSKTPLPPPVPPKDSPTQYTFQPLAKDYHHHTPPLTITSDLEFLKSPRLDMSATPTPPTPTHPQNSAHTSPPGSPEIGVALASPPASPVSAVIDNVYVDDAYEVAAVDPGLVFKARRLRKGMSRILDPNLSSDDNDDGGDDERPPTPPTPSSPMMFGRAPSPTPSEISVLSAIDTGLGVSVNGAIVSGVEERRKRLKMQEMKRQEQQKKGLEESVKSLRREEGAMIPLPLEERSPNVDGVWKRTKSKVMGATPGKRKTSQPKLKLRLKSKTPSIDTTNTSFSTSTSTSTPDTFTSESTSRSVSRTTTMSPGDTESVLSIDLDVRTSPSVSRTPSSYQYSPVSDQQAGYDFPAMVSGPPSASSFSIWSAKMGKSMEKLNIYTKSDGKSSRTRRSTMTGIRGLALKMGMGSSPPPLPTPPSTTPSLRESASVASFASVSGSTSASATSNYGSGSGSNLAVGLGPGSGSNSVTALASVSVTTLASPVSLSPGTGGETLVSIADGKGPVLILPPPPTIPPPVPPKEQQQKQPPPPQQYYYPPLPLSASASVPPDHFNALAYNKPLPSPLPLTSSPSTLRAPVAPILKKSTSTPMGLGTGIRSRPMYTRPPLRTNVSTITAHLPSSASSSSPHSPPDQAHVPSYMKSIWDLEESESDLELECDLGTFAEQPRWRQQQQQKQEEEEEESELAYMGRRKRSGSATAHLETSRLALPAVPPVPSTTQTKIQVKSAPWVGTGSHGDSDSDVDPGTTRPARRRGYSLGRRRQSVLLAAARV